MLTLSTARSFLVRLLMILTLSATVVPATGCGGSALSREQEIALGEENAPKFLSEGGGPVPSPEVRDYVNDIGNKLLRQLSPEDARDLPWEFQVINSAQINAFALPGGKVFISRGLMERLSNEAELAAVLGHEIGHVVAQHIGKQMQQAMGLQIGLAVLGAATESQWTEVLGGVGGQLYLLKFGRGQETEADDIGMNYMVKAGYDPAGMLGVHRVLLEAAGSGRAVEFLSTHPDPQRRLEFAQARIERDFQSTKNNPQYTLAPQPYQARALAPLRRLPPAPETGHQ